MKKKKLPKYQFAGINPCGEGTIWDEKQRKCVTDPNAEPLFTTTGRRDNSGTFIPRTELNDDAVDKGFNYDSDGVYRKTQTTVDPNNLGYSNFFKSINPLLDATQIIGGTINDFKNEKEERNKLLKAKYRSMETGINPYENGLNNIPIFFQKGGEIEEMQNGGIPDRYKNKGFTKVGAKRKSTIAGKKWMVLAKKGDKYKVVHGGDSTMKDFSQHKDKQRQKNFWNRMGTSNDPFSARYWHKKFGTWQDGGMVNNTGYLPQYETSNNPYNIIPSNNLTMNGVPHDVMAYPNNGQPQLMKAGGGKYTFPEADYVLEVPKYQQGGGGEQEKFQQLLQMYAQIQGIKIEDLLKQLQQIPEDKQEETFKQITDTVEQHLQQGQKQMQVGGVQQVGSTPEGMANAELEKGEVFQNQQGQINKVAETEDTHEDGGSMQGSVHRVLEDTADKRKDLDSKLLKIKSDEAMAIVGFKPKGTTTHSKLYEQATEFYDKKLKSFEKKLDSNLEYIKFGGGGKFAQNSLEENLKLMEQFPTKANIFDAIYSHQEEVKQKYLIDQENKMQNGGKPKYTVGGENPPYDVDPYKGGKTKKGSTTPTGKNNAYNKGQDYLKRWEELIPGVSKLNNIDAQNAIYGYSVKNNPKAVIDMWQKYGMTAKGMKSEKYIETTGKFDGVFENFPNTDLTEFADSYADGYFGVRQLEPPVAAPAVAGAQVVPAVTPSPAAPPAEVAQTKADVPPIDIKPLSGGGAEASKFNEPLRWYDVAVDGLNFLSSIERTPVGFEQLKRDPLRVHEVNPLPTLLQNQGDYNAALEQLSTSGVGFANQANLLANKYKVNNEVLGQYENINKGKYDQVDQFNDQAQFQLQQLNLGLRSTARVQQLQGEEVQRKSKLNALDDLFTKVAQNRKLNREGQLVMELTPYFDQYAKYNGNKYPIIPSAGGGSSQEIQHNGDSYTIIRDGNAKVTKVIDKYKNTLDPLKVKSIFSK